MKSRKSVKGIEEKILSDFGFEYMLDNVIIDESEYFTNRIIEVKYKDQDNDNDNIKNTYEEINIKEIEDITVMPEPDNNLPVNGIGGNGHFVNIFNGDLAPDDIDGHSIPEISEEDISNEEVSLEAMKSTLNEIVINENNIKAYQSDDSFINSINKVDENDCDLSSLEEMETNAPYTIGSIDHETGEYLLLVEITGKSFKRYVDTTYDNTSFLEVDGELYELTPPTPAEPQNSYHILNGLEDEDIKNKLTIISKSINELIV
jgi:hypothetical protein